MAQYASHAVQQTHIGLPLAIKLEEPTDPTHSVILTFPYRQHPHEIEACALHNFSPALAVGLAFYSVTRLLEVCSDCIRQGCRCPVPVELVLA